MSENCLCSDKRLSTVIFYGLNGLALRHTWLIRLIRYLNLLTALCFLSSPCMAGKYAADFLSIGAGAKALALGGAAIACCEDAFGGYWNPATLVRVKRYSLAMMHAEMFSSLENYNVVSFASTIENVGSIGISWVRLSVDDIPIFSPLEGTAEERRANVALQPSSKPEGYLKDVENAVFLSYAFVTSEPFDLFSMPVTVSCGGNVKYIHQHSGKAQASGTGLDLAALFSASPSRGAILRGLPQGRGKKRQISIGIAVQDVATTSLSWNTTKQDVIPMNLSFGFAYTLAIAEGKKEKYRFTLAFDLSTRYGVASHAGIEAVLADLLALRCGVNHMEPTMGVGFCFRKISLDYAFTIGNLANSHFLSLQFACDRTRRGTR